MNIKQSLVLFSSLFFSFSAMSASKWLGDWFEVEVVLISQLNDKSKLKEAFSNQEFTIDYSNAVDLFTPYLNPQIATLKQQLPVCNEEYDPRNYIEQATIWPTYHQNKTLSALNEEQVQAQEFAKQQSLIQQSSDELIAQPNQLNVRESENLQTSDNANNQVSTESDDNDDYFDRIKTKQEKITAELPNGLQVTSIAEQSLTNEKPIGEGAFDEGLTEAAKALVAKAEQAFSKVQFNFTSAFTTQTQSLKSNNKYSPLCAITQTQFKQLNVNEDIYSYLGFLINKMPNSINDTENINSETPYLLSADSLRLHSIVKQLRRSKNFRPLLHFAWRQPVFEKENSTPIKVFAGENIQGQYAKNLAAYQVEKNTTLHEEQTLNGTFSLSKNNNIAKNNIELNNFKPDSYIERNSSDKISTTENASAETLLQQNQLQKITEILQEIDSINDVNAVVTSLNDQPKRLDNTFSNALIAAEPTPPIQPWYVEGLMNIYLIGNYLHLANDFSIVNMTLAEQESQKLKANMLEKSGNSLNETTQQQITPIRMTQDRRMISREIHYFDHPYMGIIVQIRRHHRPELPLESTDDENSSKSIDNL